MALKSILNIIIITLIMFLIYFSLSTTALRAENLRASSYELNLNMDYPQTITSDTITISEDEDSADLEAAASNIYLERFSLRNDEGEEIEAAQIVVETPFIEESLDRQHRFLVKKAEDDTGWFKVKISEKAAYSKPGIYTASLYVEKLDWEIDLKLEIESFVSMDLPQSEFQIEIDDPSQFPLYISKENYNLNLRCNHSDWRLEAYLEGDGLSNEAGNFLKAEKVLYILQNIDQKLDLNRLDADDFYSFREGESITMLTGEDFERNLNSIRFAIKIGDSWSDQPAGLYKGTVVFTLINDTQNIW